MKEAISCRNPASLKGTAKCSGHSASGCSDHIIESSRVRIDYNGATAEAIDPGMLNAHEELEIRMQLNPIIESATYVVVTLTSPTGITESITVQAA